MGVAIAAFLQQCRFVGMVAYKLLVLSSFQPQHQNFDLSNLHFFNHERAKWLEFFRNETVFPDGLFLIPKWDLAQANLKPSYKLVNPQIVRITTAAFCESVGQGSKILMSIPVSGKWQIPRFRGKGEPFPWLQQFIELQGDVPTNCLSSQVTCITHVFLDKWKQNPCLRLKSKMLSFPSLDP